MKTLTDKEPKPDTEPRKLNSNFRISTPQGLSEWFCGDYWTARADGTTIKVYFLGILSKTFENGQIIVSSLNGLATDLTGKTC